MTLELTVPDRYSWVLLVGVGAGWLTMWQSSLVSKTRKAAGIAYPQVYAEKAEVQASPNAMKFNCAQRAHHNTLETLPHTLLYMLFVGLRYPEIATGLGATWLIGRILYTKGYVTGDPKKRRRGFMSLVATMGLTVAATWTAGNLVLSTL